LFVDDEEAIVEIGRKQLESLGYHVHAEKDPVKALELFSENPEQFDLVLTDMTMPHMTGDVLAQNIKQIKDIPIILATGFSTMIDSESSRDMGISEFIMKPISMVDLADIVRKVLDKKSG
ncbi:MAG: response regulator, partial [Deltaproteobacteria bacterium]|nr:response regulator [Deltaproteobacteria bacterium]